MIRHIEDVDGLVISSNAHSECKPCIEGCTTESKLVKCPIDNAQSRNGVLKYNEGKVFICSKKEIKSSKLFKKSLYAYTDLLSDIKALKNDIAERHSHHLRRLTHNLMSYNAHILQELYSIVPQEKLSKGGAMQVDQFKRAIHNNDKKIAVSMLRILKNASMSKAEFSIFEKLFDTTSGLDIQSHNIHKIILLVFNSFWLELAVEKKVKINISKCSRTLDFDYESISAALAHIIDNTTKYIASNTELSVTFQNEPDNKFSVYFDMVSIAINENEMHQIFDEGYSGVNAKKAGLDGKGIGLYIVRKLLAMNEASISIDTIDPSEQAFLLNGIPYQRNRIKIVLKL